MPKQPNRFMSVRMSSVFTKEDWQLKFRHEQCMFVADCQRINLDNLY